jgi:large subunit ribosomal protein L22
MVYKYATQNTTEKMARAVRTSMAISTKQSVELAAYLKGRYTTDALAFLSKLQAKEVALPFKRFNWNMGHKPGIGPGRYPEKTAAEFESLLKQVIANAVNRSLDEKNLKIFNIVAHKGSKTYKYSRVRGLKAKVTHVEIVVVEQPRKVKQ